MAAEQESPKTRATRMTGEVLGGRYRIVRKIGSGGMADVFEVEHELLGSRHAAKVLRHDREGSVRRFLREARVLSRMRSDHIVTVFDVCDPDEEAPYYVMELLVGQDLRRLLNATPVLSIERSVKIISDACLGISVAHAAGLVHRDLKPENLFVTHRDSGEEVAKLLDFGVAKANEGTSTEHGALIGTVRYMAPEQIEHSGVVGARADVRGLGAMLYECLTGRPPHVADSVERLLFKVLNEKVEPVGTHRPNVPEELDKVVLKALEREASDRFATASAFAEALRPFAGSKGSSLGDVGTTLREDSQLPRRQTRTNRSVWLSIAGVSLAAVVGASVLGEETPSPVVAAEPERKPPVNSQLVPAKAEEQQKAAPLVGAEPVVAAPIAVASPTSIPSVRVRERAPRVVRGGPAPSARPAPDPTPTFAGIDARNPYDP